MTWIQKIYALNLEKTREESRSLMSIKVGRRGGRGRGVGGGGTGEGGGGRGLGVGGEIKRKRKVERTPVRMNEDQK